MVLNDCRLKLTVMSVSSCHSTVTMSASDPRRAVISRLSCKMLDTLCRGFLPETQLSSRCKSDMLDVFCALARDEVIQMVYELASCEATESTDSDFGC
jgi:hypothetical protein